jgi:hypothetical protein
VKKIVLTQKQLEKAKLRLQALTAQLAQLGPMMRGSIVTNGRKHPQPYFSLNKDHRTYLIYLGERRLPAAKRLTANYAKAMEIIEDMTTINMLLLKNDAAE